MEELTKIIYLWISINICGIICRAMFELDNR